MSGTVTEDSEISNQFPIGMKVLVVDHDQTCLFLRELLSLRQYQVTLANKSNMALELVKDKKNKFDLIIIELEMPAMDGFEFLQLITLETNIPVILMSSKTNPELMEKAIIHKAYFVLHKPITIEMFNNTCLYVISKHKVENESSMTCSEKRDISENLSVVSISSRSKTKVDDSKNQKKSRVFWTNELHNKFIEAVEKLEANGGKAVPKKILELMNDKNLSRENVASHLQKHRLNLQKQPAKMGIAARNNDSFHSIHTKTVNTKTRQKPAKRPKIHLSQMSYNNFHPQPNPLHQSGLLINNIRPIPASGVFLQNSNEIRKYQQVPSYANGNILQELQSTRDNFDHLHYNNKNLLMPARSNSFLGGNQEQSGFSHQFSGFNVPNNHFEIPLKTNLDANQTGLYRNMEFGEMNRRRDDLVSGNESYLIGKENELPSGFMDLEDVVNSYRNNK